MKHPFFFKSAVLIFILTLLFPFLSNAAYSEKQVLIESKLRMLDYVLRGSASVKRIQASNNALAQRELNKAIEFRNQAQSYLQKKQFDKAEKFADDALKTVTAANRLLSKLQAKNHKEENSYTGLRKTIDSFLETFANELSNNQSGHLNKGAVDKKLTEATQLAKQHNYLKANQILEDVYQSLKEFIYQQRDNKTLIYSLDFATDKDEYEYELKRYNSFQLLLEMAEKKNKKISANSKNMVNQFVEKSNALNKQAKQLAKQQKYRDAINKLEESAKFLTRALRTMGLMIP